MKHFIAEPLRALTRHLNLWHQVMRDRNVVETAKNRSLVAGAAFFVAFVFIFIRLANVMVLNSLWESSAPGELKAGVSPFASARADILDCNGEVLATHLVTGSVYANPQVIINPEEAATRLTQLIPELNYTILLKKLNSAKGFAWIIRHISPKLQQAVNQLGIPGIYLQRDEKRVYPYGALVSHVLGYCDIDNHGLAGVEKYFDNRLARAKAPEPLKLSLDIRVQYIVRDELLKAIAEFEAEGANAIVLKVKTSEILAMVSLPDYDPNLPNDNEIKATFNRNTLGIYESGSTFKIFNTAIALETKTASLASRYDASAPIRIGRFSIKDFKGMNSIMNVQQVFIRSSNIGAAKMALQFGSAVQKDYLGRFGLLKAPILELPEIGGPIIPKPWRDITTMTVAYGYGIAVSPLMLTNALRRAITGYALDATLLKRDLTNMPSPSQVISAKTSSQIRDLMRLVVQEGTAKSANVPGYAVIGKTGSAHKNEAGIYASQAKLTSFAGAFPKDNPQYIVLLFLDNPKPTKKTHGYTTGGWNAAPTGGRIIARMAPLLGILPIEDIEGGEASLQSTNLIPVQRFQEAALSDNLYENE